LKVVYLDNADRLAVDTPEVAVVYFAVAVVAAEEVLAVAQQDLDLVLEHFQVDRDLTEAAEMDLLELVELALTERSVFVLCMADQEVSTMVAFDLDLEDRFAAEASSFALKLEDLGVADGAADVVEDRRDPSAEHCCNSAVVRTSAALVRLVAIHVEAKISIEFRNFRNDPK
jgi:hypothetical protein